ncbi:hypothetical protein BKA80DRAFT_280777 [Phyllosticta citrichinensis]
MCSSAYISHPHTRHLSLPMHLPNYPLLIPTASPRPADSEVFVRRTNSRRAY